MADRWSEQRREEEEEADEEVDENDFKSQKDAIIFAINVSKSMLQPPPASDSKKADKDSALVASLKCAYQIMQQRIITQPKDMMGILFFGTAKSKFRDEANGRAGSGYPHCYLFMDLDVPSADDVRALKSLVEEGEDPDDVLTPAGEPVAMANVLFCANQIFTTNAPNFGSRRLFIITDNDNPHVGDKNARSAAAVRAKDLYDLGVVIELFPISRGDHKFDLTSFYDDIIYRDPAAEAGASDEVKSSRSGDGITLLSSLISKITSKQTPKRSYFSKLHFQIAPGLVISTNGYIMLHRQKPTRTKFISLEGEKPQIVEGHTTKNEANTTREVEKGALRKAYKFGTEYVYFSPEEHQLLKKWEMGPEWKEPKGLRIIGFKPRSALPSWASIKKSMFIFPSEEGYVGSTRVFSALWQKLLKDDKMAIAWFIARANSNPTLVAILPSRGQPDDDPAASSLPAGLWLYQLPFADDLRELGKRPSQRCSDALIDQMRPIVQNLQLPKGVYNPSKYPNPGLQWHYKILQALALDEEVPEHGEDATKPKYKAINNRVGGYMVEFKENLEREANGLAKGRAMKREAEDDMEDRPAKKTKAASGSKKGGASMNTAQLKAAFEQGTLGKLTVVELKDILTSKGVSTAGKKQDLVERLELWIEDNT